MRPGLTALPGNDSLPAPQRIQPSAVLDQTRSTPSTLAALFCSGFAVSYAGSPKPPTESSSLALRPRRTLLRTVRSLPVALHPGVSPRRSYFPLLALQCRPGQGLAPCCSSALSGARRAVLPHRVFYRESFIIGLNPWPSARTTHQWVRIGHSVRQGFGRGRKNPSFSVPFTPRIYLYCSKACNRSPKRLVFFFVACPIAASQSCAVDRQKMETNCFMK